MPPSTVTCQRTTIICSTQRHDFLEKSHQRRQSRRESPTSIEEPRLSNSTLCRLPDVSVYMICQNEDSANTGSCVILSIELPHPFIPLECIVSGAVAPIELKAAPHAFSQALHTGYPTYVCLWSINSSASAYISLAPQPSRSNGDSDSA